MSEYSKKYYIENREKCIKSTAKWKISNPEKVKIHRLHETDRTHKRLPVESEMLNSARKRCKLSGVEFSLELKDIIIPEVCPYFGIKLERAVGGRSDFSPSLDRIDNLKGYSKDNVEVISWKANKIKNVGTSEEHRIIADRLDLLKNNN